MLPRLDDGSDLDAHRGSSKKSLFVSNTWEEDKDEKTSEKVHKILLQIVWPGSCKWGKPPFGSSRVK
jgi:hypothetical protein